MFGDNVKGKSVYKELVRYNWNGNCCGMASSSALMFADPSVPEQLIGSNDIHSLTIDQNLGEVDVKKFIESMQVAQYAEQFAKEYGGNRIFKIHLLGGKTLNALYEAICEDVRNGAATIIVVGRDGDGAHALLAYGIEEDGSGIRVKIYDCNKPSKEECLSLSKSAGGDVNGWSYEMGGQYGVWGDDDPNCYVSYVPFRTIESLWKNRGHLYETQSLLQLNSGNISVRNFEGEVVAELKDGKLVSNAEGVYEVPNLSLTESAVNAIYLPKDYYTVTSEDGGEFEASMSDNNSSATVQTTARSISFAVDDDTSCNAVTIEDASAEDTYTVSLNFSDISGGSEAQYDNVTVAGTGKGESISISSVGGQLSLANCNVGSLLINGEEQVYYTITSSSSAGGSVSPEGDCKVPAGETCTFTFTPEPGYMVEYVLVDGVNIGAGDISYSFTNVGKNHNIMVQFTKKVCEIKTVSLDEPTKALSVDYVCDGKAVLIGAIYSEDGKMLAFSTKNVTGDSKPASELLRFDGIILPRKYLLKVFMVDESYFPLCEISEEKK